MYLKPSQFSVFCFLSIIFLALNNIYPSLSFDNGSQYSNCVSNTSSCGSTPIRIAYPFLGNGHPEYCGHPGFELSCDKNKLTIHINSQTYNVISINYNTSTLRIVDQTFSQGKCPELKTLQNTTLDLNLLKYTSNVRNATLFYDCRHSESYKGVPLSFSCDAMHKDSLSFFVITETWEHKLDGICKTKVYVPIYNSGIHDLFDNSSSIDDVLKGGFEVEWLINQGQCQECFISGGCCGYDMSLRRSTCFCEDGSSYSTICPAPILCKKAMSQEVKVGTGIAAGLLVLGILITLYVFVKPKRNYQSSTSFSTSRDTHLAAAANPEEKSNYFGTQIFSYTELQEATNNFDPSKELGQGGFGTVYHGTLQDGRDVAIKRLFEKHKKQMAQFMNEVQILTRLEHPNLVKLYGCTSRKSRELLLVYEYVANGTVTDNLHGSRSTSVSFPWSVRLRIAIETARALVYLHASDIVHCDVKTRNILLDQNYSVKVADFGLSRLFPLDVTHVSTTPQGSPGYVDPEYHQCYQLTNKSDVYSFGVVLAELLSGKLAVDMSRSREQINLSSVAIDKIQKQAWSELVDPCLGLDTSRKVHKEVMAVGEVIFQCLQATREQRPSMEEVLESLTSIQCDDESLEEEIDVPQDVAVALNGWSSLASSSCMFGCDKFRDAEAMAVSSVSDDSKVSILVNVSSDNII